jgi:hypothetical protein
MLILALHMTATLSVLKLSMNYFKFQIKALSVGGRKFSCQIHAQGYSDFSTFMNINIEFLLM